MNTILTLLTLSIIATAETKLWYDQPASDWETHALPIGNGSLGAMMYGGYDEMLVHFNQDTLWLGNENDTGSYQSFGYLKFAFESLDIPVTNYRRELDISTAVHQVSFSRGNTRYHRKAFSSHPEGAIYIHCSANRPGAYSGTISLTDDHGTTATCLGNDTLQFVGQLKNGMRYAARVKILTQGGKRSQNNNTLRIEKADSLTFVLIADTDYVPDFSKQWKGKDPVEKINRRIQTASAKTLQDAEREHIKDYRQFFDRATIDLGASNPALAKLNTEARLINYWKTKNDPDFEELIFNFGRYLLISSSRPGTLPTNLQGIWNRSNNPPWRSDYHSDINVDMNYWLAEVTNLSDLRKPFFDWVVSQQPVAIANTKKQFGTDGWAVQYENGIHGGGSWRWNHSGASWFAQQFWDHYSYTLDKDFLKNQAIPVMRGVCQFWEDWLIEAPDGTLIAPKGWSAEHGPTEDGVTYDQQFAWDAFTNYIDACRILNVEKDYAAKVSKLRSRLMPLKIGNWGQLQEWLLVDRDKKQEKHRHLSHLIGLYPGRQITPASPALFNASKKSLIARGDGGAGWALPWKAALWARHYDGNQARHMLNNKLKPILKSPGRMQGGIDGTSPNLFTIVWGVLQIDGSMGYPAAIAEMLVHSHEPGKIHLLPSLPDAWANGSIKGFKLRGGHTLDMQWKDKQLTRAVIKKGPAAISVFMIQGKVVSNDPRIIIK